MCTSLADRGGVGAVCCPTEGDSDNPICKGNSVDLDGDDNTSTPDAKAGFPDAGNTSTVTSGDAAASSSGSDAGDASVPDTSSPDDAGATTIADSSAPETTDNSNTDGSSSVTVTSDGTTDVSSATDLSSSGTDVSSSSDVVTSSDSISTVTDAGSDAGNDAD